MSEEEDCLAALELHAPTLSAFPNVVGLGVGEQITRGQPTGRLAVKVYVKKKLPRAALKETDILPKTLELPRSQGITRVAVDVVEQDELKIE